MGGGTHGAIEPDALGLLCQPQYDCQRSALLEKKRLCGGLMQREAIFRRWSSPRFGESSELIVALRRSVMRRACRDTANWNTDLHNSVGVSVNVSGRQLRELRFSGGVLDALNDYVLPPDMLELELTEGLLTANLTVAGNVRRS